ncbi:MAG TPA: BACON domain-containing carbohydrate-binding protein, partial [Acidobacteriota bacterium]
TVTVSTDPGCKWTANSNDNWITITSGSNGTGHAAIGYSVAANNSLDRRVGSISLAGQLFKVTQASTCSFEISPVTQSFTAAGGSGTVTITTPTGCSWTASSNAVFISINSNMSGVASGTVTFSVGANRSTEARTGTLTIGGATLTITQSGATPEPEKLYFAQIAKGDGVECEVLLANPSTTAVVSGKIEFLDDNGFPFTAGMADSTTPGNVNFSLPPLASLSTLTDTTGRAVAGSVRVTSDGHLGGMVRFRVTGVGVASVEEGKPLSGFLVPVRSKGHLNSGIALHNVESTPLVITLSLHDKQGSPVSNGVKTIGVAAAGHFAQFISELFPVANTESFEGILLAQVIGEGKIVAIALELGSDPGAFSTLPVIPLK